MIRLRRSGASFPDASFPGAAFALLMLAACGTAPLPPDARLPRPDMIYVADFRVSPAAVNVDTNQFSYVMGGLAMARDAHSRDADAAVARQAITATLLAQLRDMGLPAVAGPGPPPPGTNALLLTGTITNITEAIPGDLAELSVGAAHSQVNARAVLIFQLAGAAPRPWRRLTEAAPVTDAPTAQTAGSDTAGTPLGYLPARTPQARTAEVARQAQRLALRLAAQLRTIFVGQGWLAPQPAAVP